MHAYSPPADFRERFFRSDSPESSTRCALCTSRSRMLSATVGSPIWACQAETTQGPIRFPEDYEGKWVIFFSHPADFTPVCTTEFMTFASMQGVCRALNCELVGLSIDSTFSHIAWLRTIKEKVQFRNMKDIEVTFPVISDLTMEVSRMYGMLQPAASTTQAVRAVFMIDPEGKVRAILYYPPEQRAEFPGDQTSSDGDADHGHAQGCHPRGLATRGRSHRATAGLLRRCEGPHGIDRSLRSVRRLVPLFQEARLNSIGQRADSESQRAVQPRVPISGKRHSSGSIRKCLRENNLDRG